MSIGVISNLSSVLVKTLRALPELFLPLSSATLLTHGYPSNTSFYICSLLHLVWILVTSHVDNYNRWFMALETLKLLLLQFILDFAARITCLKPFSSIAQSSLTLCSPMDCSMSGFPVHHQLPEPIQTHVQHISDAIQPSWNEKSSGP